MESIKRAWRGEEELWKVFWLYGLAFIAIESLVVGYVGFNSTHFSVALFKHVDMWFLPIRIWWWRSVWRCSKNAPNKWKVMARLFVVLAIIGRIIVISGGDGDYNLLLTGLTSSIRANVEMARVQELQKTNPVEAERCFKMMMNYADKNHIERHTYFQSNLKYMETCTQYLIAHPYK